MLFIRHSFDSLLGVNNLGRQFYYKKVYRANYIQVNYLAQFLENKWYKYKKRFD